MQKKEQNTGYANRSYSNRFYIYTCKKKVNYAVENTRVGQMVDLDKLTIEVWTDGSLKPYEALSLAKQKIMTEHLELFIDLSEISKNTQVMVEKRRV